VSYRVGRTIPTEERSTMKKIRRHRLSLGLTALAAAMATAWIAGSALADPLGTQTRISAQGPVTGIGDAAYDAREPVAAYSSQSNSYLVAWYGDTDTADEEEVWGRIVAADGTPIRAAIRISSMGTPGNASQDANSPRIAYNSAADEYLVVWHGDHELDGLGVDEDEIWGRRIRADGSFASDQFRISEMGTDGSAAYEGIDPDVVYNPDLGQYVVVWRGDQPTPGDGEEEVWARRLNPDGSSIDTDETRLSDIGPAGPAYDILRPRIAYDPDRQQYLVVFNGDDVTNEKYEVFGQRLGQGLGQIGANDFPISDTPGSDRDAFFPEVAYNTVAKRFMVVWYADKLAAAEDEVYAQLLDGAGAQVGTDDLRVSTSGPDGNLGYSARYPRVSSNDRATEFIVSWVGADDQPGLAANETEVFAQRYTGGGVPIGTPEVRVSMMGPDGDASYRAEGPGGSAYNSQANEYLLGWAADDNTGGLVNDESEIWVRRHGAGTATEPFPANCKPVPPRGTPNEVRRPSAITASYLRINQRTGSATVRRANAIDAWLNDGIVDNDLCGGSIAPNDLNSALTATSGPLGPTPPQADPRAVAIAPAKDKQATFTASAIQMCINQRIYQAAIVRANALKERLDGKLTGGDVTDGTFTQGRLRQDLTITAATDSPAPPASRTEVTQPRRQGCDAVKFTTTQAVINRRIAIQSVVRINEVLDELAGGLGSANLADGTLTKADFAPGVTP
jgi:hypothetical protein